MVGFRGATEQTTEFSPKETTISGGNGTGKSRHFDAFLWLIFGKDSQGRKDEGIKTYDRDGNTTDKAPCEVSAVLEVTDNDHTEKLELRRAFVEDWVKPRGQTEEVMKGNHTECWWNGVPVNVTEYTKRINAIIDETTFKLLTNPEYFPSLKWQEQRSILYMVAETPSIEEIAKQSDEWMELMDKLAGKSLADYRKELAVRKKKLKEEKDKIQPKIDEITISLPAQNWDKDKLEKEIEEIDQENEEIDKALASIAERSRPVNAERAKKEERIEELRRQQRKLVSEEKTRAEEATYENGGARRTAKRTIDEKKQQRDGDKSSAKTCESQMKDVDSSIKRKEEEVKSLRESWLRLHKSQYNGETVCPHCHQNIPKDQIQESRSIWESDKEQRLSKLKTDGEKANKDITELRERYDKLKKDKEGYDNSASALDEEIEKLQGELDAMPEADKVEPRPAEELEGYAELEEQIKALTSELETEGDKPESTESYTSRRKKLTARRDDIKEQLSKQEEREKLLKRKRELEENEKDIAQKIADAEQEEMLASEITNRQIEECERKVNSLFRGVTFQLFEYNIDDKNKEYPIETCKILVNGVPFGVANTAARMNAGLEVIRVVSEHFGVIAPIIIDGRESVQNTIEGLKAQIINLRVTDDKELIITHNN